MDLALEPLAKALFESRYPPPNPSWEELGAMADQDHQKEWYDLARAAVAHLTASGSL
jgi:hypothetical protein